MKSLYADEYIHKGFHDPQTGVEDVKHIQQRFLKESHEAKEKAKKFRSLEKHHGWLALREYFKTQITTYLNCLVDEKNEKKVYRLQEAIKCYSNVLNYPSEQQLDEASFQPRTPDFGDNPQED